MVVYSGVVFRYNAYTTSGKAIEGIQSMTQEVKRPAPGRLITLNEAAEVLGVCSATIRRRISDGTITGYRIKGSRAIRLRVSDVEDMVTEVPTVGTWPR